MDTHVKTLLCPPLHPYHCLTKEEMGGERERGWEGRERKKENLSPRYTLSKLSS